MIKKNLSEIIEEMTPEELDGFPSALNCDNISPAALSSVKKKTMSRLGLKSRKRPQREICLRATAAAVCFCMIGAAVFGVSKLIPSKKDSQDIASPILWEDILPLLYGSDTDASGVNTEEAVLVEKAFYKIISGSFSEYEKTTTVSEEYIGRKIGTVTVKCGWYNNLFDSERDVCEVKANVYEINGFDSNIAVALKYLEEPTAATLTHYYAFVSPHLRPEKSISELYDVYNAAEQLKVYYKGTVSAVYTENGKNKVMYRITEDISSELTAKLLKLTSTESFTEYSEENIKRIEDIVNGCSEFMCVTAGITILDKLFNVYVFDNGYVCFVALTDGLMFFAVDQNITKDLISTVKEKAEIFETGGKNESYHEETTMSSAS